MNTTHKNLFLYSLIYLITLPVLAQERVIERKVNVNNRVYSVSKSNPRYKRNLVLIRENEEFIKNQKNAPGFYTKLDDLKFSTPETVKDAVIKVLGKPRILELSSGGYLIVVLYPDYLGRIKATDFTMPADLSITIEELDQITAYIQKRFQYDMPENIESNQKIGPMMYPVRFDRIAKEWK